MAAVSQDEKALVQSFWEAGSCGEVYAVGGTPCELLRAQAQARYALEPYLAEFAGFGDGAGLDVLEVGVGMGADHAQWARHHPRSLTGVDLTPRAVAHTRERLACESLTSDLRVADAEALPWPDNSFDLVYSWGVLHHSPDTPQAVREVYRVLRPGGQARVMVYHTQSIVGSLLWLRYALLAGSPGRSLADVYAKHLESPGTKAYSVPEARQMFNMFTTVDARSQLAFGDLLEGAVGQRHRSAALTIAKAMWPRWFIRRCLARHGLLLLVSATK